MTFDQKLRPPLSLSFLASAPSVSRAVAWEVRVCVLCACCARAGEAAATCRRGPKEFSRNIPRVFIGADALHKAACEPERFRARERRGESFKLLEYGYMIGAGDCWGT